MKNKTTTLYILRHGQTEDNVSRIIQGHNDSPLTQEGILATRDRAKKLKGVFFDAIFCSVLKRARKSLEIILEELDAGFEVNYCKDLREIDFGQLTGKIIEDVKEVVLFHKENTWKHYPEGENGDSFNKRIINFVKMVLDKHKGGVIMFMTHFGVIETILKHYVEKLDSSMLNTKNYETGVLSFNDEKAIGFKWI